MAKKNPPTPTPAPPTPATKLEAVRWLLAETPDLKPEAGVAALLARWNITMNASTFSAYKTDIRREQRESKPAPDYREVMRAVRAAVQQHNSVDEFATLVDQMSKLVEVCGSFDAIRQALEDIKGLQL